MHIPNDKAQRMLGFSCVRPVRSGLPHTLHKQQMCYSARPSSIDRMTIAYPKLSFTSQVKEARKTRPFKEEEKACPFKPAHSKLQPLALKMGDVTISEHLYEGRHDLAFLLTRYKKAVSDALFALESFHPKVTDAQAGSKFATEEMARWFHLINKKTKGDPERNHAIAAHPAFAMQFLELALLAKHEEALLIKIAQEKRRLRPLFGRPVYVWKEDSFDLHGNVLAMVESDFEEWIDELMMTDFLPTERHGCPAVWTNVPGQGPWAAVHVWNFLKLLPKRWNGEFKQPWLVLSS